MSRRQATKVYCWNYDGRNNCGVLASSWKEAVAKTRSTVFTARQYGQPHIVGESWITEWPYERGKPMFQPICEHKIPWREKPYSLVYPGDRASPQGTWV